MTEQFSVHVSHQPIDTQQIVEQVRSFAAGAVVLFLGTAREFTDGRQTAQLAYEAYAEMAERELAKLIEQAADRWPIDRCRIVHRLGVIELREVCVAVALSTPHRQEAFAAAQWIMDELKRSVPIWKQEQWSDGTRDWVHPGVENRQAADERRETPGDRSSLA